MARQLLTGSIASEEEASYIKEYLNLVGEPLYYNCLYIVAYNNAGDSSENAQQIRSSDDFNHVIANALQNYLGSSSVLFLIRQTEPMHCFWHAPKKMKPT